MISRICGWSIAAGFWRALGWRKEIGDGALIMEASAREEGFYAVNVPGQDA